MDTFALGVVLINLLTGSYLFESCLLPDYAALMASKDSLEAALARKVPAMAPEELRDVTELLYGMLQEDPADRLSIQELNLSEADPLKWLTAYPVSDEDEIGAEMKERVSRNAAIAAFHGSDRRPYDAIADLSLSAASDLRRQDSSVAFPIYEHFSFFQNVLFLKAEHVQSLEESLPAIYQKLGLARSEWPTDSNLTLDPSRHAYVAPSFKRPLTVKFQIT